METMIVILTAFVVLLGFMVALTWATISFQIKTLNDRIRDYYLITPDGQKAQGVISARLYEAMKDVCAAGEAQVEANGKYKSANNNNTSLVSDVAQCLRDSIKADKELTVTVDRLKKIDETHGIVKR